MLQAAARAGRLEACQWIYRRGPSTLREPGPHSLQQQRRGGYLRAALEAGARGGHRAVCEWALQEPTPPPADPGSPAWSLEAVEEAARGGHVELLDWLLSVRPDTCPEPGLSHVLACAAEGCALPAFRQLCARQDGLGALCAWERWRVLNHAVGSSLPDWEAKAEWLMCQGCELGTSAVLSWAVIRATAALPEEEAAERLRWLEARGAPLEGPEALRAAVETGHAAAARHLLGLGVREGADLAVLRAVEDGHLPVLKAIQETPGGVILLPGLLTDLALTVGQPHVAEWLTETFGAEEASRGERALFLQGAVRSGSIRLMRYVRQHQYGAEEAMPWSRRGSARKWRKDLWVAATESGSEEALEFLMTEWGVPLPVGEEAKVWAAAAVQGDLHALRALRRLGGSGLPWGSHSTLAASVWRKETCEGAPLAVLQWLLAEGCPADWQGTVKRARRRFECEEGEGPLEAEAAAVLAWAREQRALRRGGVGRGVDRVWEGLRALVRRS
ncbi:hypothetical protein HYH03_013232 [Edaphochlamys debaryana]|uniref:Ankyrin repeat domain-containing protein n=1 Tax=Edaphochlamys debaryana TaxID=47281 RepID=A0A835XU02_9CHLO|nr:hypothetical protein HYH03_013232 [Edaphochlamys debaryana]|eukprot:KAG2488241.1 hypothetical protein HYH03_013232 [Edaphochlamys debaryana]